MSKCTDALLLALALACSVSQARAQDDPPKLVVKAIPKSTPGYRQLFDPETRLPLSDDQIVFNQVRRICLRYGSDIPAIVKLAKAEKWISVPTESRLNQLVLKVNGVEFNRSAAWEFNIARQRYFVAVTPQHSFSMVRSSPRTESTSLNKCEIKVFAGPLGHLGGLKSVFQNNAWTAAENSPRGTVIYNSTSTDREIILLEDYQEGAASIEIVVM